MSSLRQARDEVIDHLRAVNRAAQRVLDGEATRDGAVQAEFDLRTTVRDFAPLVVAVANLVRLGKHVDDVALEVDLLCLDVALWSEALAAVAELDDAAVAPPAE